MNSAARSKPLDGGVTAAAVVTATEGSSGAVRNSLPRVSKSHSPYATADRHNKPKKTATEPDLAMAAEELVQFVDEEMSTAEPMEDEVAVDTASAAEQDASSPNVEGDCVTNDKKVACAECGRCHLRVKHGERGSFAWTCTPRDGKGCGKHYDFAHISAVFFTSLRRYPAGALGHDISETKVVQQSLCAVVQPPSVVQTLVTLVMQVIKILQTQQEDMRAQQKAFLAIHEQRQTPSRRPPAPTVPEVVLVYDDDEASAPKAVSAPVKSPEAQTYAAVARRTGGRAWPRAKPIANTADAIAALKSTDMKKRFDRTTGQLEAVAVRGIGRHSFQITRNSLRQQGVAVEHIIDMDYVGASTLECVVRADQADAIVTAINAISDGSSQHPFRAERGFDASLPPERQGGASAPAKLRLLASKRFAARVAKQLSRLTGPGALYAFHRHRLDAVEGQQTALAAQLEAEQVASAVNQQPNDSDVMIAEQLPTSTSTAASSSTAPASQPATVAEASTDAAPTSSTLPLDGR
ncbi:hypothetical protein RI367_007026 [Sorochytrium milnesiophthora]